MIRNYMEMFGAVRNLTVKRTLSIAMAEDEAYWKPLKL